MIDRLLERYRSGDRLALSRLLSLAARGEHLAEISRGLPASSGSARVVAMTGSGGVGKSSLVGKLIGVTRKEQKKVAVLACDPQSPLSGGALLGDRVRMAGQTEDDGVFIRSLAALSGHEGLAGHLQTMIHLCEGFGVDVVIIETAGAGQGDTAVHDLADVVVLLLQPETGDDLQWEKAGVFEVADILVLHKADLPGAEQALAQVRSAVELSAKSVPIVKASSRTGEGVVELWRAIQACPRRRRQQQADGELLDALRAEVVRRFNRLLASARPETSALLDRWRSGTISGAEVARELLDVLARQER
jgi:LAO/AO transport system ATPase